jgi:hypothetical protein
MLLNQRSKGGSIQPRGFGYYQLYYKRKDSGEIGKFPPEKREAIIDVRQLGSLYEWVVLKVDILNFHMTLPPFPDGTYVAVPFEQDVYVVLSPEFVIDQDKPEDDLLGRYGWGYAIINMPPTDSILAYGPEDLGPGFMTFYFDVYKSGEVRLSNSFVVNQPVKILNIPLNPVDLGIKLANMVSFGLTAPFLNPIQKAFDQLLSDRLKFHPVFAFIEMANRLSGGRAEREFCISQRQLLKAILAFHFEVLYDFLQGTTQTWNQIPDWTDEKNLPSWAITGKGTG